MIVFTNFLVIQNFVLNFNMQYSIKYCINSKLYNISNINGGVDYCKNNLQENENYQEYITSSYDDVILFIKNLKLKYELTGTLTYKIYEKTEVSNAKLKKINNLANDVDIVYRLDLVKQLIANTSFELQLLNQAENKFLDNVVFDEFSLQRKIDVENYLNYLKNLQIELKESFEHFSNEIPF